MFDPNSTYRPTEGLVCHGHAKAPRCRLCGADLFARVGRLPCGPTERYLQGRPSSLCFCLILWEPPPISISIYYIYIHIRIYSIGSISFRFSFLSISDAFISIYDVIIDIVSGPFIAIYDSHIHIYIFIYLRAAAPAADPGKEKLAMVSAGFIRVFCELSAWMLYIYIIYIYIYMHQIVYTCVLN